LSPEGLRPGQELSIVSPNFLNLFGTLKKTFLALRSTLLPSVLAIFIASAAMADDRSDKEMWELSPDYETMKPKVIAVVPMDNFSLEPNVEKALYEEVYERLKIKGYMRIAVEKVDEVMKKLGIQTPGQLAGISLTRLGKELKCDAVLMGQIEQSGAIHTGVYDAVAVSCSLRLVDCATGTMLWQTEQWRAAHRQWQADPINLFINVAAHEKASREKRVAWLVHEMLKTLPQGHVDVQVGDLLNQAQEIPASQP
jgi:hypothetical protein